MPKLIDLTGKRFGRLLVIERSGSNKFNKPTWLCRCDCGKETIVSGNLLAQSHTRSCGCLHRDSYIERSTSHGMSHTQIYNIWQSMISRCTNPNEEAFKNYGGRGITVCDEWRTFEKFYADMGEPPTDKHEIDRENNNLGYNKDNCRWATSKEQNRNRRNNRIVEINDEKICLAELAERCGIAVSTLAVRLNSGWPIEKAISAPTTGRRLSLHYEGKDYSLTELAAKTGMTLPTLCRRLKAGWSVETAVTTPLERQYKRRGR